MGYGATSSCCIADATRYRTRYRKDDASLSVWQKKRDREQRVVVATRFPTRCRKDVASLSGRLRKEWNMERQVVVASLMQHGIELGIGKMMHHWQWDRERRVVVATQYPTWCRKDDASLSVWQKKRDREQRVVVATQFPTRCRKDDASLSGRLRIWSGKWLLHR